MESEKEIYSLEKSVLAGSRAFLKDDFKAVIYWLRPHLKNLCPDGRKMLLLAIKRFNGGLSEGEMPPNLLARLKS